MLKKTSVILPTYNERENITPLVKEIIDNLKAFDYEIIIVDDNSPDGTGEEAKKLEKEYKNVQAIIRIGEKGLAKSIKDGILTSKGDYIIVMDTDFSHPSDVIPRLLEHIEENDLVIASRYTEGGSMDAPFYKFFLSKLLNQTIRLILGLKIKDLTGGFFIIKRELVNNLNLDKIFKGYGDYFFELAYLLNTKDCKIKEIPFNYGIRKYGDSKTVLIKIGIEYITQALKIRLSTKN